MRILNYNVGDRVRVTHSEIIGTVIKIGGQFATVKSDTLLNTCIRIQITRLRHIDPLGVRLLRSTKKTAKTALKWITRR